MKFEDYCDKRAKRIGINHKQYDFWTCAADGYNENYKSNLKTASKLLEKDLEELSYGRGMYAADMGYEFGKKKAINDILNWRRMRNKDKK